MKKSRFSEEQIMAMIKEQEGGAPTAEVCSKRALVTRRPMVVPETINERWSLDFVSDAFTDGRRFRVLAVVDDFTCECLALVPDTSLSGARLTRELDAIIQVRGMPTTIVSDNGTEMTSSAVLEWCQKTKIDWHYIAPGKPR